MKILCDDCGDGTEAAVFCSADEAALCFACDRRIHRANKVAGNHIRFTLLHSSSTEVEQRPLCDICQEKQGIVFCKEERIILCYDCDFAIHAAKRFEHSRFVLSGTRLPAASMAASSPELSGGSSSISDYLIKMLPGYCVEDLLVDDSMNQFTGNSEDQLVFKEGDLSFYVPDAPPQIRPEATFFASKTGHDHRQHVAPATAAEERWNGGEEWGTNIAFTVPQLNCVPASNKRPFQSLAWF